MQRTQGLLGNAVSLFLTVIGRAISERRDMWHTESPFFFNPYLNISLPTPFALLHSHEPKKHGQLFG